MIQGEFFQHPQVVIFSDFKHQQVQKKNSSERLDLETKSKEGKVGRVTWLAASKRQISPKKAIEKGWGGPKLTKKTATQVAPAKDRFDQLSCWYDLHSRIVSKTNKTLPYPLSQDAYLAAWQGGFPLKSSFPSQCQKCSKIHWWVPHGCS